MEVVITSLDALIHRATMATLERPDPAALEAFCAVMADAPNGSFIGTRVIASRVRSPHPAEALLALDVLDACMKRCGRQFHQEVDKFRFLNELIKLVSPKYSGNKTAPAVRQKVLNLMQSWTVDYPSEIKIRDAYEMLKKQGVVKKTTPVPAAEEPALPAVKPRTKDAIFEDEEKSRMLQKLLQSKNPEDLLAANRLIKTMVREDERRVEAVSRRLTDLQAAHNNARLLDEMLEQYRAGESSAAELQLIRELHAACSRLRPTIYRLAAETQQHEEILNEILDANDELGQVFDKYTTIILHGKTVDSSPNTATPKPEVGTLLLNGEGSNSLLDLASGSSNSSQSTAKQESTVNSNLDELGDIFSSVSTSKNLQSTSQIKDIPVLQPINLTSPTSEKEASHLSDKEMDPVSRGLAELDALGEDLLKQSLPVSAKLGGSHFNHKSTSKIPMNSLMKSPSEDLLSDLQRQTFLSEQSTATQNNLLDLDFLISKTLKSETGREPHAESCLNDDAILDIALDEATTENSAPSQDEDITLFEYLEELKMEERPPKKGTQKENKVSELVNTKQPTLPSTNNKPENNGHASEVTHVNSRKECAISPQKSEVKPLTDINISLASIKPGSIPPLTVFQEQDGLAVVLHFAENKPREDVFVIVISTTSKHSQPIEEFKFHAVVPKGCKVRLLPASGDSFPTFSPFLPPAAITQVMLVGRPPQQPPLQVYLKFVITYTCQDDTVSEMGEVSCLPFGDN